MALRRIQRQRKKGWRLPDGAVYVGRPSRWGNPFRIGEWWLGKPMDRLEVVQRYREMWTRFSPRYVEVEMEPLRGQNLVCWCPLDQPCHADVLLELAA